MEKIYDKCCGVDIHRKLIVACFKQGRKQEIREFEPFPEKRTLKAKKWRDTRRE